VKLSPGRIARRIVREVLTPPALILGALLLLWEEVLWVWLGRGMAQIGNLSPVAHVENIVRGLPPYSALATFLVPLALTYPPKLIAFWLMATGKFWSGAALLAFLEVLAAALLARVYTLCKPALHSLAWFAKAEAMLMAASTWAHERLGIRRLRRAMADAAEEGRRSVNSDFPDAGGLT
jgi:hypothetical protein